MTCLFTPTLSDPTVENLVTAIREDLIGGAADMARETARALRTLALDESIGDSDFPSRFDEALAEIIEVTPSIMPVTRVLHATAAAGDAQPGRRRAAIAETAAGFIDWLNAALDEIARIGADLIRDGDRLFLYSMSST